MPSVTNAELRKSEAAMAQPLFDFLACCGTDQTAVASALLTSSQASVRGKVFGMAKSLRCRTDYLNMTSAEAISHVRLLSPRHWFLNPLNEMRKAFYDENPQLATKEAQEWNRINGNRYRERVDIARLTQDFFSEWFISSNVIAIWKRRQNNDPLPAVIFPDPEHCKIISDEGYLAVEVPGSYMGGGKRAGLIISKNPKRQQKPEGEKKSSYSRDRYAQEWDFQLCQNGKVSTGLEYPTGAILLDDLELYEMFRLGDWVGAYKRREALRHHKLGYAVTSGQQAGQKIGHASTKRIRATNQKMSEINGPGDLATQFDHEIGWVTFPKDHFLSEQYAQLNQRLIYHGGYCAMMLMANRTQIESNGGHLLHMLRQEVDSMRRRAGDRFLHLILNSPSYLGDLADQTPELRIQWSSQGLYTIDEMLNRAVKLGRPGYASPQTIREWNGLSDEVESERMQDAHTRREDFTPPFEFAQGMLPLIFPDEFADSSNKPPSSPPPISEQGGRPS